VTRVLQGCSKGVPRVSVVVNRSLRKQVQACGRGERADITLQKCYKSVRRFLQECYKRGQHYPANKAESDEIGRAEARVSRGRQR
jgi:hypothetical protein